MVVIIREGQTQGRETTFAKIELSSILCFALYLSTESTEGAGELALGGQRNVSSRERGKKLKFQQLEHFYLPFRMLQNAFQRTNVFNTYQRQERISREEPAPNPTR